MPGLGGETNGNDELGPRTKFKIRPPVFAKVRPRLSPPATLADDLSSQDVNPLDSPHPMRLMSETSDDSGIASERSNDVVYDDAETGGFACSTYVDNYLSKFKVGIVRPVDDVKSFGVTFQHEEKSVPSVIKSLNSIDMLNSIVSRIPTALYDGCISTFEWLATKFPIDQRLHLDTDIAVSDKEVQFETHIDDTRDPVLECHPLDENKVAMENNDHNNNVDMGDSTEVSSDSEELSYESLQGFSNVAQEPVDNSSVCSVATVETPDDFQGPAAGTDILSAAFECVSLNTESSESISCNLFAPIETAKYLKISSGAEPPYSLVQKYVSANPVHLDTFSVITVNSVEGEKGLDASSNVDVSSYHTIQTDIFANTESSECNSRTQNTLAEISRSSEDSSIAELASCDVFQESDVIPNSGDTNAEACVINEISKNTETSSEDIVPQCPTVQERYTVCDVVNNIVNQCDVGENIEVPFAPDLPSVNTSPAPISMTGQTFEFDLPRCSRSFDDDLCIPLFDKVLELPYSPKERIHILRLSNYLPHSPYLDNPSWINILLNASLIKFNQLEFNILSLERERLLYEKKNRELRMQISRIRDTKDDMVCRETPILTKCEIIEPMIFTKKFPLTGTSINDTTRRMDTSSQGSLKRQWSKLHRDVETVATPELKQHLSTVDYLQRTNTFNSISRNDGDVTMLRSTSLPSSPNRSLNVLSRSSVQSVQPVGDGVSYDVKPHRFNIGPLTNDDDFNSRPNGVTTQRSTSPHPLPKDSTDVLRFAAQQNTVNNGNLPAVNSRRLVIRRIVHTRALEKPEPEALQKPVPEVITID